MAGHGSDGSDMSLGRMHGPTAGLLVLILAAPAVAQLSSAGEEASICVGAAREASEKTGVPLNVLLALTLTETGRRTNGKLAPWPWALNQAGDSHWFPDSHAALAFLTATVGEGHINIDVGCFQLNYRWHGGAFPSLEAMMEPGANALYAARMVSDLAGSEQDWIRAAGAYHSGTPEVAKRYLAKFAPILMALEGREKLPEMETTEQRTNGFPLLQASGFRSAGSIVPIGTVGRPLIGAP